MEWKEKGVHGSVGKMKNNGFLQQFETLSLANVSFLCLILGKWILGTHVLILTFAFILFFC